MKEKDRKRGTTCRTREPLGHRVRGLAKERRVWKEGTSSSQEERERMRDGREGGWGNSLDTPRVDVRERDRTDLVNARVP